MPEKDGSSVSTIQSPCPAAKTLVTLRRALHITKLPKGEHDAEEWQASMEALLLVVEYDGPTMFARTSIDASVECRRARNGTGISSETGESTQRRQMRNADNYNPQYVGMTERDFRTEVFNDRNTAMIFNTPSRSGVFCICSY